MADGFDLDEQLQKDADTLGSAAKGGFSRPPLGKLLMQAIFTLGVVSVMLFVVMLPFVGQSKAIPAEVWIGGGTLFMAFFFVVGVGIKMALHYFEP